MSDETGNPALEGESSRTSSEAAGWYPAGSEPSTEHWEERLEERKLPKWDSFSWLTLRALLESANDVVAKAGPTTVRGRRARWVEALRAAGMDGGPPEARPGKGNFRPDFVVDWTRLARPRFVLLGDPGEADASQYAAIDPLLTVHGEKATDFMVIVSDVIYPAGDINEYINAFYIPYGEYARPIYALPGNHDWYDGLNGFMFHFCAAEPLREARYRRFSYKPGEQAARMLWRGASRPSREELASWMAERRRRNAGVERDGETLANTTPPRRPVQPAPYFAIDTGPLMIVAIDTGVVGELDAEQGDWLRRVSAEDKPKILVTGKPIYVNNEYHPCEIAWGEDARESKVEVDGETRPLTADDVVRDPANRYKAAIGGDIHNYQRYPVHLASGKTIQYIVSGGGGAYLSATHMIPTVGPTVAQELPPDVIGFEEKEFVSYPLRGDSLALFSRRIGPLLFKVLLSAPVLIGAAVLMQLAPLSALASERRWGTLAASALAAALVLGVAAGFVQRDKVIEMLPDGYRFFLLVTAVGLLGLGVACTLVAIGDPHVSSAVGVTLGLPWAVVAVLVGAYSVRGSEPRFARGLLLVAPLIAFYELFHLGDLGGAPALLAYVVGPLLVAIVGVPLVAGLRKRARQTLGPIYRVALPAAWLALAGKALNDHADRFFSSGDWLLWTVVVLAAAGLLVALAIPRLAQGSRRRVHHTDEDKADRIGEAATGAIALAAATLILIGLDTIADGWPAQVTAGAFSAIVGFLALFLLLAAIFGLGIGPATFRQLRKGDLDPAYAAWFVSKRIGGEDPVRDENVDYSTVSKPGLAEAMRRLGRAVSEVADTNEPPFYKNFLTVDVDYVALTIRCYGITGYWKQPTVEDTVRIELRD